VDSGEIAVLALAAALAFIPAAVDRWALRHGASPEALIALAVVTLAGTAAVPVAFVICATGRAFRGHTASPYDLAAVAALLLVAIAAGRTLARVITIRRRWKALTQLVAALQLPAQRSGVTILPLRERELDVLADRAAARRVGHPALVQNALLTIAAQTNVQDQAALRQRLERLEAPPDSAGRIIEETVRLATLAIGAGLLAAICLSIHTETIWLGIAACTLLLASLYAFTRPALGTRGRRRLIRAHSLRPSRGTTSIREAQPPRA
jgi:hypothetical protein